MKFWLIFLGVLSNNIWSFAGNSNRADVIRPDNAPDWSLRVLATVMLPTAILKKN